MTETLLLSRLQFALTAIFHMLWPVLSTGLAIFLVILEVLWLRSKDPLYYRQALAYKRRKACVVTDFTRAW